MRAIPQAAVDLEKEAEGLRLTAYPDPATGGAPWTIGYGHTGPDVRPGLRITNAQAEQLLQADLDTAAAVVDRAVTVELTDRQRGALVSFVFNVGAGRKGKGKDAGKDGFVTLKSDQPSTLLRKLHGSMHTPILSFWTGAVSIRTRPSPGQSPYSMRVDPGGAP